MMQRIRHSRAYAALTLAFIVSLISFAFAATASAAPPASRENGPGDPAAHYSPLLKAIRMVESNDNPQPPGSNDNGKARGAYQIHYDYWKDARIGGHYGNVSDTNYATRTVVLYWRRHCPEALASGDLKTLAMTHHSGPSATFRSDYWRKVVAHLPSDYAAKHGINKDGRADDDPSIASK